MRLGVTLVDPPNPEVAFRARLVCDVCEKLRTFCRTRLLFVRPPSWSRCCPAACPGLIRRCEGPVGLVGVPAVASPLTPTVSRLVSRCPPGPLATAASSPSLMTCDARRVPFATVEREASACACIAILCEMTDHDELLPEGLLRIRKLRVLRTERALFAIVCEVHGCAHDGAVCIDHLLSHHRHTFPFPQRLDHSKGDGIGLLRKASFSLSVSAQEVSDSPPHRACARGGARVPRHVVGVVLCAPAQRHERGAHPARAPRRSPGAPELPQSRGPAWRQRPEPLSADLGAADWCPAWGQHRSRRIATKDLASSGGLPPPSLTLAMRRP